MRLARWFFLEMFVGITILVEFANNACNEDNCMQKIAGTDCHIGEVAVIAPSVKLLACLISKGLCSLPAPCEDSIDEGNKLGRAISQILRELVDKEQLEYPERYQQ